MKAREFDATTYEPRAMNKRHRPHRPQHEFDFNVGEIVRIDSNSNNNKGVKTMSRVAETKKIGGKDYQLVFVYPFKADAVLSTKGNEALKGLKVVKVRDGWAVYKPMAKPKPKTKLV